MLKGWGWDLEGPSHRVTRSRRVSRRDEPLDLRRSPRYTDEGQRKVARITLSGFPIWRAASRGRMYLQVCNNRGVGYDFSGRRIRIQYRRL